jgi:glycosyltransferase involved in cell wall biosynthesis
MICSPGTSRSGAESPVPTTLAYLAPSFPAHSSTFVQDELLELERRGFQVLPITVRRPPDPAPDHPELIARTHCLYDRAPWRLALQGLAGLPAWGGGALRALGWLAADLVAAGLWRPRTWKLAYQCLVAVRLARMLKERGCAHLHVHFIHVPAQIAMYASALSGVPFTVTAHANDIFEHGLLLARKARRARRVLAISAFNREQLIGRGVAADRIAIVRCAARLPACRLRGPRPESPLLRVGTLGRLIEKKGVDVLIDAVARLANDGIPIALEIAGDGPLRGELRARARRLGLDDCVRFLGALTHREVADWMGSLDAFALACKPDRRGDMDGIPVVLMEAMSLGIPVVATRLSGIPELVIHEQTGLKAAPGDAVGLATQLARLRDPALRARLGDAGAEHVRREFSSALNVDRLLAAFDAGPGAPAPVACQARA